MLKLCRDTNAVRSTAVRLLKLYAHRIAREHVLHGQLLEMFCQCFLGTYWKKKSDRKTKVWHCLL